MFSVTFVFPILKLNFSASTAGILRCIRAAIFSVLVFSFFSMVTS